jgi:hypothetical protein
MCHMIRLRSKPNTRCGRIVLNEVANSHINVTVNDLGTRYSTQITAGHNHEQNYHAKEAQCRD